MIRILTRFDQKNILIRNLSESVLVGTAADEEDSQRVTVELVALQEACEE